MRLQYWISTVILPTVTFADSFQVSATLADVSPGRIFNCQESFIPYFNYQESFIPDVLDSEKSSETIGDLMSLPKQISFKFAGRFQLTHIQRSWHSLVGWVRSLNHGPINGLPTLRNSLKRRLDLIVPASLLMVVSL